MADPAFAISFTYAEYVALEAASNLKHEFREGQIYAMAGGSPEHAALAAAVTRLLGNHLAGRPCRVYSSDLRVRVPATGLATYPDVSVVCGLLARDPGDRNTVTNPTLLVEVLSPNTEAYDRGGKFDHYRQLAALREYLLVAQDERRLELRRREADGSWSTFVAGDGEAVPLASIGATLAVRDVYRDAFEEP